MKKPTMTHLGLGAALLGLAAGTAWALTMTPVFVNGHTEQGRAGSSFALADLDGDGTNELLVGEPAYDAGDPPGDNQNTDGAGDQPDGPTGRVLIYKVTNGAVDAAPSVVLNGEGPDDRFGAAIQVGDVTNDGIPDVIVSAITASGHDAPRTGCVYVFDGETVNMMPELDAHDAVAEVCGSQYREYFGKALALGNFDGVDGLDIAVGAPWYSAAHSHVDAGHPADKYMAGAVYLVPNEEIAAYMAAPTTYEIHAPITNGQGGYLAHYGDNLLAMGDRNTDGKDELLIFAPAAELSGHSGKGRAYLATWDEMIHEGETTPAGFEEPLVIVRGNGRLGEGDPAFLGDLTGDGIPEIGMASTTPGDKVSAGGIFVVDGDLLNTVDGGPTYVMYDPANDATTVNPIAAVSYAAVSGEKARDYFGTSMAALGDVNGDGAPDFAVGAPWADGFDGDAYLTISGSAYVVSGQSIVDTPLADRLKFAVRRSTADNAVIQATLLGETKGRSNDRLGEAMIAGPLLPSATTTVKATMVVGAPDRDPDATSTLTDVPGTGSNDNRGAAQITSFSTAP